MVDWEALEALEALGFFPALFQRPASSQRYCGTGTLQPAPRLGWRVGVYYMANATDVSMEIADVAIALLRGEEYPLAERQPITVDPRLLARYVGVYDMEGDVFTIKLREESCTWTRMGKRRRSCLPRLQCDCSSEAIRRPSNSKKARIDGSPGWSLPIPIG